MFGIKDFGRLFAATGVYAFLAGFSTKVAYGFAAGQWLFTEFWMNIAALAAWTIFALLTGLGAWSGTARLLKAIK